MEKYNIRDLLFEELIELTLEAEDFEDAIKKIGEDAYRKGYVKGRVCGCSYQKRKAVPDSITHGGTQGCNPSSHGKGYG